MTRTLPVLLPCLLSISMMAAPASAQDLQPPPPLSGSPSAPYAEPATTPAYAQTNATDESRDSGLGLEWIWFNADIGIDSTSMDSLNSSNLQLQKTSSTGPVFALAGGVRLLFFTAGARIRDLQLSDFSLWEIDGEAAFHIRIDHVDPYFGARGGYAFVGTLSSDATQDGANTVNVHGFNAGLMFGFDYYFNHILSVGLDGNPEFLFLQRPPLAIPAAVEARLTPSQKSAYQESGSSVGFGFAGTAHLGVHF